jgi:hypothetical protein
MSMNMAHYNPIEFIVLSFVFVAMLAYMVFYHLRLTHRQETRFGHKGHIMNSPGSIAGAMTHEQRGDPR